MTITPGPLPNNGDTVDASIFLEEFVRNTEVAGITQEGFKNSGISFVQSQTDPPHNPDPGWLWYKRGEGVLYLYTFAVAGLDPSGQSDAGWVAIGGRRDYWGRAITNIVAGRVVSPASTASSTGLFFGGARFPVITFTDAHGTTNWAGLPLLVAESCASGRMFRGTEIGFVTGLVATAQTAFPGPAFVGESLTPTLGEYGWLYIQAETNPTVQTAFGYMNIAYVVESAETTVRTRKVFKKYRPQAWISKV